MNRMDADRKLFEDFISRVVNLEAMNDRLVAELDACRGRIQGLEDRERAREENAVKMQAELKEAFETGGPLGLVKKLFAAAGKKPNGEVKGL